jgi:hypothetical protein
LALALAFALPAVVRRLGLAFFAISTLLWFVSRA